MKIVEINAYQVALPIKEGRYSWSGGNYIEEFDSTVVEVKTDEGLVGYGECCPLGSAYLPSYAAGVRAGLTEIAPHLLRLDPRNLSAINATMDASLRGHPYAKAAVDVACWDILGKASNLPVKTLLGGERQDEIALYRAISQRSSEEMAENVSGYAAEGYTRFQLKVGGAAGEDIARIHAVRAILADDAVLVADANTGWTQYQAVQVVKAVADLDVYIEQPCMTYEECRSIRRRTALPFVLDEVIDGVGTLSRALAEDAMDVINLKISKVGGLTRAKLMRDLCVSAGIAMTIEDTWGGDIVTATIAHLASSTPEALCFGASDFNSYGTVQIAEGAPQRVNGKMSASNNAGLGVSPDFSALGKAVLTFR